MRLLANYGRFNGRWHLSFLREDARTPAGRRVSFPSQLALVKAVEPGSAAAQVGLRNNDVIIGANRSKVSSVQQLKERAKASAVLVLEVRRNKAIVLIPLR